MTRLATMGEASPRASNGAVERLLKAREEAPRRRPLPPNLAFANFVDAHRHVLVDWMARRMTAQLIGPDASQVDPDDVLSRALERLWLRFEHLPPEPGQRKAWVEHALRLAALDAIRFQFGRHKVTAAARRPPQSAERDEVLYVKSLSVDFGARPTLREREGLAAEAGRAIQRLAAGSGDRYDDILTRAAVVAAMATLTTSEQRVLRLTIEGCEPKEIVAQTGLEPAEVREQLTTARWLVRSFVDHADADRVPQRHRLQLHAYLDGELRGRARTRLRRHLRECAACQRAADLYHQSDQQAIGSFALPALVAAAERTSGGAAPLHWLRRARPRSVGRSGGPGGSKGSLIGHLSSAVPGGKLAALSTVGLLGGLSTIAGAAASVDSTPTGQPAAVAAFTGRVALPAIHGSAIAAPAARRPRRTSTGPAGQGRVPRPLRVRRPRAASTTISRAAATRRAAPLVAGRRSLASRSVIRPIQASPPGTTSTRPTAVAPTSSPTRTGQSGGGGGGSPGGALGLGH